MNGWEIVISGGIYLFFALMYYSLRKRDKKDNEG